MSPDHHGTIEERQQLRHDLIRQLLNALRHRLGHAVLASRCLHGQDVIIVRRIEQEVGKQRSADPHRMKTDQPDGRVVMSAASNQPRVYDSYAVNIRQRDCWRALDCIFRGGGVRAAVVQLNQQFSRQGLQARPLEQLDQWQVDVERAQDPIPQLRQHQ